MEFRVIEESFEELQSDIDSLKEELNAEEKKYLKRIGDPSLTNEQKYYIKKNYENRCNWINWEIRRTEFWICLKN